MRIRSKMLAVKYTSTEFNHPLPATKYFPLTKQEEADKFAKEQNSEVKKEYVTHYQV